MESQLEEDVWLKPIFKRDLMQTRERERERGNSVKNNKSHLVWMELN